MLGVGALGSARGQGRERASTRCCAVLKRCRTRGRLRIMCKRHRRSQAVEVDGLATAGRGLDLGVERVSFFLVADVDGRRERRGAVGEVVGQRGRQRPGPSKAGPSGRGRNGQRQIRAMSAQSAAKYRRRGMASRRRAWRHVRAKSSRRRHTRWKRQRRRSSPLYAPLTGESDLSIVYLSNMCLPAEESQAHST